METKDNVGLLYNALKQQGFNDIGDENVFRSKMSDENNRKQLYNALQKNGFSDMGDYDTFNSKLSSKSPGNNETSVSQQVIDEFDTLNESLPQSTLSPYVRGKGKDTQIFGVPYTEYQKMSPEEQSRYYSEAIAQKKQEEKNYFSNYISTQMGEIDTELNQKRDAIPVAPGAAFIPSSAAGAAQRYGNTENKEVQDKYTSLHAAKNLLDDANKIVEESKKGDSGFFTSLGRGFKDKFVDADNWTMGLTDASYSGLLRKAIEKEEHGEDLSPEEAKLLDAAAVNMATQAFFSSDLSRGYNAGNTTAQSIPFMLEFAINPISSTGNAMAKGLLKYGLKRFGSASASKLAKVTGRIVGDAAAAAGMTATTGLGRVAAGTNERMIGDVQARVTDGEIKYAGRENGMDTGEALAKSAASNFLENQSEMFFNAFAGGGKMAMDALNKVVPGLAKLSNSEIVRTISKMKNNPAVRELAQRTQFHGILGEYAEEVYNNLANIPLGEMTIEQAMDLDQNIDTFLGLAPTSVSFGLLGIGGMAVDSWKSKRNLLRFKDGLNESDKVLFDELQQVINAGDKETTKAFVKRTLNDKELSQEDKRERIFAVQNMQKEKMIGDIQQEQPEVIAEDIEANKTSIYREFIRADRRAKQILPKEIVSQLPSVTDVDRFAADNKLNDAQKEAVSTYADTFGAFSVYQEDVNRRRQDIVNTIKEQASADIDKIINKDNGFVIQAKNKFMDKPVYIERGNLVFDEAGLLDKEKTSEKVYFRDENGDLIPASPDKFDSIISQDTKEELIAEAEKQAENDFIFQEEQSLSSPDIPQFGRGETVTIGGETYLLEEPDDDMPGNFLACKLNANGEIDDGKNSGQIKSLSPDEYYSAKESELWGEQPAEKLNLEIVEKGVENAEQPIIILDNVVENETSSQGDESNVSQNEPLIENASIIPSDDKGNLLYHKAPVETTIEAINSEGLEADEIDSFVSANREASAKLVSTLESKSPKMGTSIAKYKADKLSWNEKLSDARAQVDYWNSVSEEIAASRVQLGDKTAEAILSMGEPMTGEELAATMLGTGRLPILYESYKKETGGRNSEARGMVGLFASKANGGVTIEEAGELLMLADQENGTNFFDPNDPNAGRNAIIDVLSGARTRGDLFGYIQRNREVMAERERQAEYDAYSSWTEENFGMTPEDYEAYEEQIPSSIAERFKEFDENEFYTNIVNELDGEQGEIAGATEGSQVLQGEGAVSSERIETSDHEGGTVPISTESSGQDGTIPEEARIDNQGLGVTEPENMESPDEQSAVVAHENGQNKFSAPHLVPGESVLDYVGRIAESKQIFDAEQEVDTNPTDAQKEAGNYRKGHVKVDGYDISIENPKGSERTGADANGNPWSVTMNNSYGYIRKTEGADGDHIDVFLSDNPSSGKVYVVDQVNEDGSFDEHKVMYGFSSADEAKEAYLANYSPGWKGLGNITEVSKEDFKKWVESSESKINPFYTDNIEQDNSPSGISYTINKRYHKKNGSYIYAVNFTNRLDRDAFKELKSKVKEFGGYYSSFGKGGFIFDNEADGGKFAEAIVGRNIPEAIERKTGSLETSSTDLETTAENLDINSEKLGIDSNLPSTSVIVPSENRLVTDERYAELRERMRKKLGGQMNIGIDPEILAIGTEMAVYHIEKGSRKFSDFAKGMIRDLGDAIRPYLKAFYNGARDLPEIGGMNQEMNSYEDVSRFDVANFDKSIKDVVAMSEQIVKEASVDKLVSEAKKKTPSTTKKAEKKISSHKEAPVAMQDLFNVNIDNHEGQRSEKRNPAEDRGLGKEEREEVIGDKWRRESRSLHGDNVSDANRSGRVYVDTFVDEPVKVERNINNFTFADSHIDVPVGEVAKLKANIEAIRTLKAVEESKEPTTNEQKTILSRYVGWGGLADVLNEEKYEARKRPYSAFYDRNWNEKYLPYYEQIKELLSPEEFSSAVQSTTTSHYTPEPIIRSLWNIVERLGFKGGIVSEPAMGVGHILGLMPKNISTSSQISGFEIDSLSGRISKTLYPDSCIQVAGYETAFFPKSKDLVITNVPFGKNAPYDKVLDKSIRKRLGSAYNLHNYFISKGLLELKEGGLGVFVTSSSTMDGADSRFREFVQSSNIDLIGAIRLPNDAFQKNAGTSVTADMLFFRKRNAGELSNGNNFISTTPIGEGTYQTDGETHTIPIMVNEYFANHPEMMLGEMMTAHDAGSGGLYSGASQTLKAKSGTDITAELKRAIERLPKDILKVEGAKEIPSTLKEITNQRDGTLSVKDNKVFVAMSGNLEPLIIKDSFSFNGKTYKTVDAVKEYNTLKETLKKLIIAEQGSDLDPEPIREELNRSYDDFVLKYGTLNRNKALDDILSEDFEHNLPFSLEDVKRIPSPTGKSMVYQVAKGKGILSKRISFPVTEPKSADSLQDALNISRSYRGRIDVPFIASLTNESEDVVIDKMLRNGIAYREPLTGELVDKDSYLSGNIREKLEVAREALSNDPTLEKNVMDLTNVMPETIRFGDISYRLGTTWIPAEHINKFAEDVLGISNADLNFIPVLSEYVLSKSARISDFSKSGLYRTDRLGTLDLFEAALNQRKPKVYDEITTYDISGPSKTRVVNEMETQAAAEKVMEVSDKFVDYIDSRKDIHKELERLYNDKYNNFRLKEYDLPIFQNYPNSNREITLRGHQMRGVQRSLESSTLLAHQVGTGKTFTMITTAMEMRRLGIARKPMIVVQNATLEDFVKDFYKLYPGANVLAPGKDERSAENRKRLFNLIATGDFDAIVIPQSFMQFIPDDEGRKQELIRQRIEEYESVIEATEDVNLKRRLQKEVDNLQDEFEGVDKKGKKRSVKDKAKSSDRIKSKMERQLDRRTDEVMTFEKMGIDALFIDEAHNFKKIGFASKMSNVKGIDTSSSQRANSLLLKAKWIQEKNNGRNVILATGTPITNTMAEVWTMMNFVSPEILEAYNINTFDEFATTFGTVEPSLEFTATGNFKIADRFKSYVNVPELVKAFRSHADVVLTEDVKEFQKENNIPKLNNGQMTNVVIDKNEDLQDVMDILIQRLEDYSKMTGKEKKRMSVLPLVVFTKAKQAAIDLRLLNPFFTDNPNSKTNQVISNVLKLYKESSEDRGAQLIFCDSYQSPGEAPKMDIFGYDLDTPRFNLYEDIKQKLIEQGVPAKEIAIVNNYDGERRKNLFEKVRSGDVRILLGSTEKMGVGVNVQDRLFALHHIDAPIRPMDFEQRNGRILRQGNLYATWGKSIHVLTYGVQETLDATAYDRLRIKQNFINQMMKGDVSGRVMEELDDEDPSGMTFNQMAATLSGDKTAQLLFVAENKLKKLRNLKRSDANSKSGMAESIEYARQTILILESKRRIYEEAKRIVDEYFPEGVMNIEVNGKKFTEKFGPSIEPFVSAYDEAYSLNRGVSPLKMKLNGNKGEVIVHFNAGRMVYELYAGSNHIVEGRQFNGGKGLVSSIEHQLKAVSDNLAEVKSSIANNEKKIAGLNEAMNAPWGRDEELKIAEEGVSNLRKQLEEKAIANSKQNSETDTKRGHRVVNEEVNDYPNRLEVDSVIQNFKKQVNNHPEVHLLYAERDIENLSTYGANEQAISDLREALHNKSIIAAYVRSCNAIVAFPAHALDADEIESFLWHENTHYILHNSDFKDLDTLMSACFEYVKEKKPAIYNHIIENYSQEEWNEESVTYLVQDMFNNYGADKLLKSKFAGDSSVSSLFNQLFNEIKNGKSREHNRLRQDGDILYGTTTRQNEKGGSIRKGLEKYPGGEFDQLKHSGPSRTDGGRRKEGADVNSEEPEGGDGTQQAYEKSLMGNKYKAQEAYQDSMLALRKLQEVIENHSGEKLKSFENAYMAENHMSSKSTRETEVYGEHFFKPMLLEVGNLMKTGASHREVLDYIMAKHGLERNEVFAMRDAEIQASNEYDKQINDLQREYDKGHLQENEFEEKADALKIEKADFIQTQYSENRDNDYSGLSSLTGEEDYEAAAKEMVDAFEERFDTMPLWNMVNSATKETLRKSYESGMMSKQTYEKVKNQFKCYIPLRGWNEQTAADVYEYFNSEVSPVNSVLKSAKGRTSIADDPLAVIGNMAESTILQGNRNLMKQRFMNMAINHPSDLLSISEAWYVIDPSTGEWTISYPHIEENDSADLIAQKVEEHESRMRDMQRDGEATKISEGLNIDYRINRNQAKEHIVSVKRNGKDYLIYVNANPRAAQAVNGMTNPDVESNKVLEGISKLNRQLAANFTTRNPAFVLSNLVRDLIFSTSAVFVKEDPTYAIRYTANIPNAMKIAILNISGKAKDEMFEEFLANGGETGYTALHNVDEYKRMIKKELGDITGKTDYFKYVKACAHFFSMLNRWAEDVSRFNAFMTSRELGRTVSQSIHDAKEVTVNFNKKGSGYKTGGAFGLSAGIFRNFYLFFNAAVQSLANFGRLAQKNKTGFRIMIGVFTAAGFIVPVLNNLVISLSGDDDDDYYNNLSDWERRNNICIYTRKGIFAKIPLPIELRAFYGLGEMAYQETIGNGSNGKDIAYKAINQMTELLPINPLGNSGDLVTTLMPDILKPFWQINENMDFMGKPIYRDNSFNKTMPEWTKAYGGTSKWLVNLSEWSNELAGGDKYKTASGFMNWNPAKVEHLFESYFGGMATTINQTGKTLSASIKSIIDGEKNDELIVRNMPVINRFVSDAKDDRTSFGKINTKYFELYNQYEETKKNLNGYIKEASTGNIDYLKKLSELQNSKEYEVYKVFEQYQKQIERIRKAEKKLSGDNKNMLLQEEMIELKKDLIERIEGI